MALLWVSNICNRLQTRGKKPSFLIPLKVWQDPLYFFAFGLGTGTIPFAPGTFGTLMAIPFYCIFLRPLTLTAYLIFIIVFFILSAWACSIVSQEIKVDDHPGMCIDEFVGFFVTMINAPYGMPWIILGFVLFRVFDILKPGPIKFLDQHVHGGFGMVLDDAVAGLCSCFIIQILKNL